MTESPYEKVYQLFKRFVSTNSKFKPKVLKKPAGDTYPKVIVQKISDVSTAVIDPHSLLGFEFNIYTKDLEFDGELLDSMEVAEELESLVKAFMGNLGFKRIMDKPTPNVDQTIFRITMQYIGNVSDTRGCFF